MAQAAGLPVVCTPFAGSERSVLDGQTGLFCKPDDPDSLAQTIARLIPSHDLWHVLGKAGSQYVRERFDKDRQVDVIAELYRSLLL
jgi:glycosyltransferase involved in cell wall biosynthesis